MMIKERTYKQLHSYFNTDLQEYVTDVVDAPILCSGAEKTRRAMQARKRIHPWTPRRQNKSYDRTWYNFSDM